MKDKKSEVRIHLAFQDLVGFNWSFYVGAERPDKIS